MPNTRLRRARVTAGSLACLATLGATTGAAAAPGLLPDLVADPPEAALTSVESVHGRPGHRLLLRFDGHVHNAGPGRLEIFATGRAGSWDDDTLRMTDVRQRVYDAEGALVEELPSRVDFTHAGPHGSARHNHWHTNRASAFWLVRDADRGEVVESDKIGFCLADSTRVEAPPSALARYQASSCRGVDSENRPLDFLGSRGAASVVMGVSPGFVDVYRARYFTQWVDLTDRVPPGHYRLKAIADPTGVILETQEDNAPAYSAPIALRGWVAEPVRAPAGVAGAVQRIPLSARKVVGAGLPPGDPYLGEPDPAMYALAEPPAHGTVTISGAVATYVPAAGYAGPDRFTVRAMEEETMLQSPAAPVDLEVRSPGPTAAPALPPPSLAPPVAGADTADPIGRVRVGRRGRLVTVLVATRAPGRLRVSVFDGGRLVGRCARIRVPGGPATSRCRLTLPRLSGEVRLAARVELYRGGELVARSRAVARARR